MAHPERIADDSLVDPSAAIDHAYRFHRMKRRARDERLLRRRYAGVRFAFTLALLAFVFVLLGLIIWNEIQSAFGL